VLVAAHRLAPSVDAWFTGRGDGPDPPLGRAGNLAHRRPHRPGDLARDRREAADRMGVEVDDLHLMHQVHGADVAVVDAATPRGAELRQVDAAVTAEVDRPLAVTVADCVPVLLAGPRTVAAVHAGRAGVALDVLGAALATMATLGDDDPSELHAVVGPAIGGCCYEVPAALQREVVTSHPAAEATTTWGTPSLDLPAAVSAQLDAAGVPEVGRVGGCTRCDPQRRWFSHRADPDTGRQVGVVVRRGTPGPGVAA
jgi:polyphenol oxidase